MLYTGYDSNNYATPPIDVYCENFKRIILISDGAFTEVNTERGINLIKWPANQIIVGPFQNLTASGLSIESRAGSEPGQPSELNIEKIQIDFTVRTGTDLSMSEQLKRCAGLTEVLKRIIKKIISEYILDLTIGWPIVPDERYIAPYFSFPSLEQFPIAQSKEADYGYSGGVRLSLQAVYERLFLEQ